MAVELLGVARKGDVATLVARLGVLGDVTERAHVVGLVASMLGKRGDMAAARALLSAAVNTDTCLTGVGSVLDRRVDESKQLDHTGYVVFIDQMWAAVVVNDILFNGAPAAEALNKQLASTAASGDVEGFKAAWTLRDRRCDANEAAAMIAAAQVGCEAFARICKEAGACGEEVWQAIVCCSVMRTSNSMFHSIVTAVFAAQFAVVPAPLPDNCWECGLPALVGDPDVNELCAQCGVVRLCDDCKATRCHKEQRCMFVSRCKI